MNNFVITGKEIESFLNTLMLLIGLDCIWFGYYFLKTSQKPQFPKMFAYFMFWVAETGLKKDKSNNESIRYFFSPKAVSIYSLVGGVQMLVSSIFYFLGNK